MFYPISPIFYRPIEKRKEHVTLNDYYTYRLALEIIVNSFAFAQRGHVPLLFVLGSSPTLVGKQGLYFQEN